jgi:dCMP deaminase
MKTQKSWDSFYMCIAEKTSELSYANDRKVGCVVVNDGNILSFSYNGTVRGTYNDTQQNKEYVLHAETQALSKMARHGIPTKGCTLYSTLSPCVECAKIIYQMGISRVVFKDEYKDLSGIRFLKDNGVIVNDLPNNHSLFTNEQLKHTGLLDE